jgi:hypothetical protein
MKVLITIGMVIIFISVFFILLTGDSMFRAAFECAAQNGESVCVYRGLNTVSAFGIFIIAFFILIDILTVYLIATNVG